MLLHHLYSIDTFSEYDEGEQRPGVAHHFPSAGDASYQAYQSTIGLGKMPASLAELQADKQVHFVKTHGLPVDKNPAVYLVRDGRDALVSYAHFLRTFQPPGGEVADFQTVLSQLVRGEDGYGGWDGHVVQWTQRSRQAPTVCIRYEDLVRQPVEQTASGLARLGIDLPRTQEHYPTFEELQSKWPSFFRKGKTGSWREEMSADLQRLFWHRFRPVMEQYGYGDESGTGPGPHLSSNAGLAKVWRAVGRMLGLPQNAGPQR